MSINLITSLLMYSVIMVILYYTVMMTYELIVHRFDILYQTWHDIILLMGTTLPANYIWYLYDSNTLSILSVLCI